MELSKSQKKVARELIRKALHKECSIFLADIKKFVTDPGCEKSDSHESYLKLYKEVATFDKHIARRYDDMRGSRYFTTLLGLFHDKVLQEEDLALFNEEIRTMFLNSLKSLEE